MRFNYSILEIPDLPEDSFKHCGDKKIKPQGGGKGSGSSTTTVQIPEEQKALLRAQTDFLTGTAFPEYRNTITGAKDVYGSVRGQGQNTANLFGTAGQAAMRQGLSGLSQLFSPDYEQKQIQGAIQPYKEQAAAETAAQTARYGSAGQLGSARAALADANLAGTQAQRYGNVAANVMANVQNQRNQVGQYLTNYGTQAQLQGLNLPQDLYNKYASVVYGIPQGGVTPNFAGTQGSSTSGQSKGKGIRLF